MVACCCAFDFERTTFHRKALIVMAATCIFLGAVTFALGVLNVTWISMTRDLYTGIWMGSIVMVAGLLGIVGNVIKSKHALLVFALLCGLVCFVLWIVQFALGLYGVLLDSDFSLAHHLAETLGMEERWCKYVNGTQTEVTPPPILNVNNQTFLLENQTTTVPATTVFTNGSDYSYNSSKVALCVNKYATMSNIALLSLAIFECIVTLIAFILMCCHCADPHAQAGGARRLSLGHRGQSTLPKPFAGGSSKRVGDVNGGSYQQNMQLQTALNSVSNRPAVLPPLSRGPVGSDFGGGGPGPRLPPIGNGPAPLGFSTPATMSTNTTNPSGGPFGGSVFSAATATLPAIDTNTNVASKLPPVAGSNYTSSIASSAGAEFSKNQATAAMESEPRPQNPPLGSIGTVGANKPLPPLAPLGTAGPLNPVGSTALNPLSSTTITPNPAGASSTSLLNPTTGSQNQPSLDDTLTRSLNYPNKAAVAGGVYGAYGIGNSEAKPMESTDQPVTQKPSSTFSFAGNNSDEEDPEPYPVLTKQLSSDQQSVKLDDTNQKPSRDSLSTPATTREEADERLSKLSANLDSKKNSIDDGEPVTFEQMLKEDLNNNNIVIGNDDEYTSNHDSPRAPSIVQSTKSSARPTSVDKAPSTGNSIAALNKTTTPNTFLQQGVRFSADEDVAF